MPTPLKVQSTELVEKFNEHIQLLLEIRESNTKKTTFPHYLYAYLMLLSRFRLF